MLDRLSGLKRGLLQRLGRSPVWWANFGAISRRIAESAPPDAQPVLIVSHPRSGSTWLGATLGQAANALYLREPVTQTHLRTERLQVQFEIGAEGPPASYLAASAAVERALPSFPPDVVLFPEQWSLRGRRLKRPVVKEVNPLALRWFAERWRPKIIFLIRHPAAVAASYSARRWPIGREGFERRFRADRFASGEIRPELHAHSEWSEFGAVQAIILRLALEQLRDVPDHVVVKYEALCEDPPGAFRRLYDFAGLDWDDRIEALIRRWTEAEAHDRLDVYGTVRNSRLMAQSWRNDLKPEAIAEVRDAYLSYSPAYYGDGAW